MTFLVDSEKGYMLSAGLGSQILQEKNKYYLLRGLLYLGAGVFCMLFLNFMIPGNFIFNL